MTKITSETTMSYPHLSVRDSVRHLLRQGVRPISAVASATACTAILLAGATAFAAPQAQARASEQASDTHALSIPSQPLAEALKQLSATANEQLLFSNDLVTGKQSAALEGTYTTDQALAILLKGSGLVVDRTPSGVLLIKDKNAKPGSVSSLTKTSQQNYGNDNSLRLSQADNKTAQNDQADASGMSKVESDKDSDQDQKSVGLQEIVVTAQKREERLQDVPISITAITADDIDRRGLVNAADYLRGIPGVSQVEGSEGQSIVIRGIETSPKYQNFGSGATTATYFGETPTTNSAGMASGTNIDLKLVDIERVEVLRGPQGTAFGNSSMGGAVRTIPVAPKLDDFEAKVSAGYSGTSGTGGDNYNVQAVGNIPLVRDKFAFRATGYRSEDSGFYRNRGGSDAAFQAQIAPSGAVATDKDEVGSEYVIGGRIAALFQASDDLRFTLSYLSQKTEMDGLGVATSGTFDHDMMEVAPDHVIRGQTYGLSDSDIDIANATMGYNFGWANLLATYSNTKSGSTIVAPFQLFGGIVFPVSYYAPSDHQEDSGEIRLTTQLDGAWNFLGGLYFEELDDDVRFDYQWVGDPATNPYFPGERFVSEYFDQRNLKQKAAFGEVSWEFLPRFTLTGGVRAYDYERTVRTATSGPFFGETSTDDRAKASGTTFRGNLSYKPGDDALLYAVWSQGFRLGKPQPGLSPTICDLDGNGIVDGTNVTIESTKSVDSDDVDNIELGGKFTLLDRRLLIAADVFRIDWTGLPVRNTVQCGAIAPAYVANAGSARSEGVEFEANFQVTTALRVDIGGSRIRARLTEDAPGLVPPAFDGDRLPGSAETNASLGLQYEFAVGGYKTFVRADSIYVGPYFGNLQESADTKSGDYVKLDASARLELANLNIDLFVRNLTNENAFTFRDITAGVPGFYGYRLRPRTVGIQLTYRFGQ